MGEGDSAGQEDKLTKEEDAAVSEREFALRDAMLAIGASLDLDTVLAKAVESARTLTGAAYGVIATVGRDGAPQDFVTSGFTAEQHESMEAWPDALRLFGHLHALGVPLRLPNLDALVGELSCSPFPVPCGAFQATPMRHGEEAVGSFFLGGKEGGFTDADEEMLVLFAQQAAAALSNARAHRDEQGARADLEALVETCPVAVVVLDAQTGVPLSLNREARRILAAVDAAERSPEQARVPVVCRRGDGSEVDLGDLLTAVPVRAEEVEISVPGGGSMRALLDATPIHVAGGGPVERLVATLQDLAPFEAAERSRAEFLGLVSHELRAPLAAIKGSAAMALNDPRDPDRAELLQYLRIVEEQADRMSGLIGDLLDTGLTSAGMLTVDPAPQDLTELVERARTAFAAGGGRHAVVIDLPESLPRAMADARRIVQVLNNLLDNAARHSPETAPIRVSAQCDEAELEISVADQGEGIPAARLHRLFRRHANADRYGGTGLGLVICRGLVEAHGGRIRAESALGRGTRIVFTLPAADAGVTSAPAGPRPADGDRTAILVVDDDPHALRHARAALEAAGYDTVTTTEPGELSRLVEARKPALAVLDLVLPGVDGIELMRTLPALSDLPVIMASAYGSGDTIARALEAGAADYIVKPFSGAELAARVALALRRGIAPAPFRLGELAIDRVKGRVTLGGRRLKLTATEYRLLHTLSLDAGGVTTFAALQRRVWGEGKGNPTAVRSAIRKLRSKLGDDARNPTYIFGERGLGYRMPEPDEG